ncbi:MAG: hypothetical protein QM571_02225 [Micrococcaceae bacterium]
MSYSDKPRKNYGGKRDFDNNRGNRRYSRNDRNDNRRNDRDGNRRFDRSENRRGRNDNWRNDRRDKKPFRGRDGGKQRDFKRRDFDRDDRPSRPSARGPKPDEDITGRELPRAVRAQLRTLKKENAESVMKHLAMVDRYIEEDAQRALSHAMEAVRTAGRIGPVREAAGLAAYAAEDFKKALAELRTHKRISGSDDHAALIADSLRGVGKPDKAIEAAEEQLASRKITNKEVKVDLCIALSGAYMDNEDFEAAKKALEIPELNINKGFTYSPRLFRAYAETLEALEQEKEAKKWRKQAKKAEVALGLVPDDSSIMDLLEGEEEEDETIPATAAAEALKDSELENEEEE